MKIILASKSLARKKLLSLLKVSFIVIPSKIEEDKIIGKTPLETIRLRAKTKVEEVVERLHRPRSPRRSVKATIRGETTALTISADSMAILKGKLIGKPKDKKETKEILKLLSGKTHEFITAIYMIKSSKLKAQNSPQSKIKMIKSWQDYERSLVTFRKLTDHDINLYLKLTNPTKYAAGYALLDTPQDFVVKIQGSISNVMGLPLEKIIPILRNNKLIK